MMTRKDFQVFAEEIGKAMNEMMSEHDQMVMVVRFCNAAQQVNPNFDSKKFRQAIAEARGLA